MTYNPFKGLGGHVRVNMDERGSSWHVSRELRAVRGITVEPEMSAANRTMADFLAGRGGLAAAASGSPSTGSSPMNDLLRRAAGRLADDEHGDLDDAA